MHSYFLDTSALAKRYHRENGSSLVDQMLEQRNASRFISRLAIVEFESVLATKARTGAIGVDDIEKARRRFRADVVRGLIRVTPPSTDAGYRTAKQLVARFGPAEGLRTLDALQIAAFMALAHATPTTATLVSSDKRLCRVAQLCGCNVANPENPELLAV